MLERFNVFGRRRQAGEIERRPSNQRAFVGGPDWLQPVVLEARENEAIDVGLRPGRVRDGGDRRMAQRLERPERPLLRLARRSCG